MNIRSAQTVQKSADLRGPPQSLNEPYTREN